MPAQASAQRQMLAGNRELHSINFPIRAAGKAVQRELPRTEGAAT